MKIYILPVFSFLQPKNQILKYPVHNKDYGVEQDFLIWVKKQKNILTTNPETATWHYLPVFWTRWHINHNFATNGEGLEQLQYNIDKIIINDAKTFTITQFDGGTLIKNKLIEFTAARTINSGIDIPILCSPHKKPLVPIKKKYIATFNGSFHTHPLRETMKEKFAEDPSLQIGGTLPTRFYQRWFWATSYNLNTMAAFVALCPRGTSANSYRFFEAMQLGTAPCLIGEDDVRPFKKFIPWDEMSYFVSSIDELENVLKNLNKKEALEKGRKAFLYWKNELRYQKWCKYIIKELEAIC